VEKKGVMWYIYNTCNHNNIHKSNYNDDHDIKMKTLML